MEICQKLKPQGLHPNKPSFISKKSTQSTIGEHGPPWPPSGYDPAIPLLPVRQSPQDFNLFNPNSIIFLQLIQ